MKYSIFGFNQELVMNYENLNTEDLLLLDYIYSAIASPSMQHIIEHDVCYVWLQHNKIQEDLPILQISEDRLKRRIKKLIDLNLLQSRQIHNGRSGSKSFYAITENCEVLRFRRVENNTSNALDVLKTTRLDDVRRVENNTSYNLLTNKDNKLKNNNKDNRQEIVNTIYNLYLQLCSNLPKPRVLTEKRKSVIYKAYKDYGLDDIKECFKKANDSDFLCGKNDRGWKADIEWLLGSKFINVLEGKYDTRKNRSYSQDIRKGKAWEENVKCVPMTNEEREEDEREADRLEAMGIKMRF